MNNKPVRNDPGPAGREAAVDTVPVGEIVKPHGIRGEIKIYPYSGNPENFTGYRRLLLERQGEPLQACEMRGCRRQGQFAIVALHGIHDRTGAEALTGCRVLVERQALPETQEGEYYWHDLQGMEVVTADGLTLGRVREVMATGAQDLLVVVGQGREYLIPAVDGFVVEISSRTGRIVVDPPEGLLDLNG